MIKAKHIEFVLKKGTRKNNIQKDKQNDGKEGKPLLITGKVTPAPSDIENEIKKLTKENHTKYYDDSYGYDIEIDNDDKIKELKLQLKYYNKGKIEGQNEIITSETIQKEIEEKCLKSFNKGIQKATNDILLLIDDCRKGLLTNQQADILHVKICKLNQIQKNEI
jgi:hypothetical protein